MYKIKSTALSDIGLVRQNNEDLFAELPDCRFYVIADGMGGHQAGEIAAKTAVDSLLTSIRMGREEGVFQKTLSDSFHYLKSAVEKANQTVFEKGRTSFALKGMGPQFAFSSSMTKGNLWACGR